MRGMLLKLGGVATLAVFAGCARTTEVTAVNVGDETVEMNLHDGSGSQPGPLLAGVVCGKAGRLTYVGPAHSGVQLIIHPWKDGRTGADAMNVNIVPGGRTELEIASENGRTFIRNTKIQTNVYH